MLLNVVWVTGRASACKKFHTNNLQRFCFERPSWNLAYPVTISRKNRNGSSSSSGDDGLGLCVSDLLVCLLLFFLSLHFTAIFPCEPGLTGFIGARDNGSGGDNWNCKTCKAPVKSSPLTNQHPTFYTPDALPVTQPAVSKQ